jgi:serine/threonine protein kinase
MENIPNTFENLLERNGTIKGVQPKLKTLANLLVYLDKEYGFRHRDLHAGNVMFTEGWELKLIDFGRCCMEYYYSPGRLSWYSMPRYGGHIPERLESAVTANGSLNNAYCFSLDILILIIYLLQDYTVLMDFSLQQMFYRAVISNKGKNLYDYCEREAARDNQPPFAYVYPWSFQAWDKEGIDILLDTPTVFLHGFQKFITGVKEEDYREVYVPPVADKEPNSSWFCKRRGANGDCLAWARRLFRLGGGKTLKKRSRHRITRKH